MDQATIANMSVRAVSVRGLLHYSNNVVRQDSYALASTCSRVVAVVCDGIGDPSLPQSHLAADLAATSLAASALENADDLSRWDSSILDGFQIAGKLLEEAENDNGPMATTAVVMVGELVSGEWNVQVAWVGDSSCWHLGEDGTWRDLTAGHEGPGNSSEFQSTSTDALPRHHAATRTQHVRLHGGALLVMSDGVGKPLQRSEAVRSALGPLWTTTPDLLAFADQVNFARRGFIDDRTVIGIWPRLENSASKPSADAPASSAEIP
jgi:serine/threonine protein phosphatase PrpC